MYIDNIVRDIQDLIYLNNVNWDNIYKTKRDAEKFEDLPDALYGLDQAMDALNLVEERLKQLVDMIEMEALSAKVQSK
jgi:hypothetical protein